MIYLNETPRPIFTSRKETRANRRRMEPVSCDATGAAICVAVGLLAVLVLGFLASPWCPDWLFIRPAGAEEEMQYATVRLENADGVLNVRSEPGTEYPTRGAITNGARLAIIEERDGWALVNWPRLVGMREPMGWVCAEYLEEDEL